MERNERRVQRLHISGEVLAALFDVPGDAKVTFAAVVPSSQICVLFIESDEFEPVQASEIPPQMKLRLTTCLWTSELTKHSDSHYTVAITHRNETRMRSFEGEAALQEAEMYHIAQRQRAGLL